jgi:hypothetical protein
VTVTDGTGTAVAPGVGVDTFRVSTNIPGAAVGDAPGKYAVGPTVTEGTGCASAADAHRQAATPMTARTAITIRLRFLSFTSLTVSRFYPAVIILIRVYSTSGLMRQYTGLK